MLLIALAAPRLARAAAKPADVDASIEKAKPFLYAQQNQKGTWEEVDQPEATGDEGKADVNGRQWGGLTSMAVYALLAAGDSPQDPRLAKAIAFLKTADIRGIYALGLRCQVWLRLRDDKNIRPLIMHDRDLLLHALWLDPRKQNENSFGFYSYYFDRGPKPTWWYDHSVSQYGVLGMWALEQAGAEVPVNYWKAVDMAWRRAQLVDGGWSYRQRGEGPGPQFDRSTASMTAAGIATLFITQDYMMAESAKCQGNISNENIEHGLSWMDRRIKDELSGGNYYTLYGIERIGVASGRKYFSTVDWYQLGADAIVGAQKDNGSWNDLLSDTCFAMLFLSRGRAPVIMNKLEYDLLDSRGKTIDGNWDQRPRDIANFARWMGRQIERDLNWQSVNLKVSVDELHDAPILYLSGNQELRFPDDQVQRLREFVEQGGMILGNADCANRAFAASFQKLGKQLFPEPSYKFRELEPTHVILTNELYHAAKGHIRVKITGLSNGVRELMLLIGDNDIGRAWQAQAEKTHMEAYEAGANIFLYAVDKKSLRYKGESFLVHEDPEVKTDKTLELRRLGVGENWNPEPAGWRRLAALLHNENHLALNVKAANLDEGLAGAAVAHVTGTTTFQLNDAQRKTIKDFVQKGGTLIVDAAGGSTPFASAAENELRLMFGKAAEDGLARPLTLDNPLYQLPDAAIESVHYRAFTKSTLGNIKSPRLKGIVVGGRYAVFYSREDLSAGLVGEPVDGIFGYGPESATQIMRNLILYASLAKKPPLTAPEKSPE